MFCYRIPAPIGAGAPNQNTSRIQNKEMNSHSIIYYILYIIIIGFSGRLGTVLTIIGVDLCGGGKKVVKVTLATLEAKISDNSKCGIVVVEARDFGAAVAGDVVLTSETGTPPCPQIFRILHPRFSVCGVGLWGRLP